MDPVQDKHPLFGDERWVFAKPSVGFSSAFIHQDAQGQMHRKTLSNQGTCREGVIANIRGAFISGGFVIMKSPPGKQTWEQRPTSTNSKLVLNHPECLGHGVTKLTIGGLNNVQVKPKQLVEVADALVGLPSLLLNAFRQPGDWWRTGDGETGDGEAPIWHHWFGVDNFFLRHPTLMAIVLGLYRQAWLLCKAGFGEEVLKCVDRGAVEHALTNADAKEALKLVERLQPWISVPVGKGGEIGNFPFPWYPRKAKQVSHWQRFIRLQRAIRRHGYDEVFTPDFYAAWNLLDTTIYTTGVFSFWGGTADKKVTEAHKRIMQLGKPLARKEDGAS